MVPAIISLKGEWLLKGFNPGEGEKLGVYKPDYDVRDWIKARVPGVVQLDLMRAGLIPDPFYGLNEEKVKWVENLEWWYRKEFEVPPEILQRDFVELRFMGLDTFATIWLNGKKIGETDNMFIPWIFNVKNVLKAGKNVLAIKFEPPAKVLESLENKYGRLKAAFYTPRVYGRKAQYSFGWDWGPRLPAVGIWQEVEILAYDIARLGHIAALPIKVSKKEAELILLAEVIALRNFRGIIRFQLSYEGKEEYLRLVQSDFEQGLNEVRVRLKVHNPRLWWPYGYGPQNLYKLTVKLKMGDKDLDEAETYVGIRSVKLIQRPDEEGKSFIIMINDVPIFCKGANWIPSDNFLPRVTKEKYKSLLTMAIKANMNMLRVWGGGIYEDEFFYELCDRLGIMIWQDFMFACGEYPEEEWFLNKVRREAEEVVKRLRKHPCIILWCGDNENEWGAKVGSWGPRGRIISHHVLAEVCARLDPTRPYWPSSPYGGDDPNSMNEGDRHSWDVWSGWRDYKEYLKDKGRFISEFGFQALPDIETIEAFTPPEERFPLSRVLEHHNKMHEGMERLYRFLVAHYKTPDDLDSFVYLTQVNQGEALKTGIEHWRRRKFKTSGCLIWQLNDCWPGISWSLVDYFLRPKASYYFVKRAFSPIIVSLVREGNLIAVYVVNDTLRPIEGELELSVQTFDGKVIYSEKIPVKVNANSSSKVLTRELSKLKISDVFSQYVAAVLTVNKKRYENVLLLAEPKYLKLPKPIFKTKVKKMDRKGYYFKVIITSDKFAKAVRIKLKGMDAKLSDNYFDLLPNTTKEVIIELSKPHDVEDIERSISISSIHCDN